MTRARATFLLLGVFVLGLVGGALGTGAYVAWRFHHGPSPERLERMVIRQLGRRLDLDASQQRKLDGIALRTHRDLRRLRGDTLPRVEAILDRAYAELRPILRPDQQRELERLRAEMRQRLRRDRGVRPHPFPPLH